MPLEKNARGQPPLRAAVLWENFGPYHFARLRTLERYNDSAVNFVAVEVANRSRTYPWVRKQENRSLVYSLLGDLFAEDASPWLVFAKLRGWLLAEKIDVLFVPSYWPGYALAGALAARNVGARVVLMTDSHLGSGGNSAFSLAVKSLLVGLYHSAFVAGSLHASFVKQLGIESDRIFQGYDVIDNTHFGSVSARARDDGPQWRQRLSLPSKYILSLGRLVKKKNLEAVLRGYADAVHRNATHGCHLVIVGSGPEQERLKDLAADLLLSVVNGPGVDFDDTKELVHFHPFAQVDITPVYYSLATAFVLASKSEEWGLVVNEALASSCPVIVSNSVGCAPDLVIPNVTGLRFLPESREELSWCLERVCSDPAEAAAMGDRGRRHMDLWSEDVFGQNAVLAAKAACSSPVGPLYAYPVDRRRIRFLQTCFPDYRRRVFDGLSDILGDEFELYTGDAYFTPDVRTTLEVKQWHSFVQNRFLLARSFLWQSGVLRKMIDADVVVLEMNPRVLTTWIIILSRALFGVPTLLWGHAWGRQGMDSIRNVGRVLMMRLATGVIAYNHTQRKEVSRFLPNIRAFAAPNSLIAASECVPLKVSESKLHTILYVGRLNAAKKPHLLLAAFILARKQLPEGVELCLVGEGAELGSLKAEVERLQLSTTVKLPGHINNAELLRRLYAHAFCAVSPGYVGLNAIQAFSFGVPFIMADREPHAPEVEACHVGFNTLTFSSDNPQALADSIIQAWREREAWLARREEIARWTAQHYSSEAMVSGFIGAIDAVCPKLSSH